MSNFQSVVWGSVSLHLPPPGNKINFVFSVFSAVKFEIDLPKRLVWIESDKDVDFLMETLKKCGKEVKYNGTK